MKADINLDNAGFEMIELAIDDLELLTKAFDMIQAVCKELRAPQIELENLVEDIVVN